MTSKSWKELKDELERQGLKDDDEIWFIDIQGSERLQAEYERSLGWKVTSY